jgi:hypothetical protein
VTLKQALDDGSIGFFWVGQQGMPDLETDPERGYVKRDRAWTTLELLEEDPMAR